MAEAIITTSDGIRVELKGTPEEVANVVEQLRGAKAEKPTRSAKHTFKPKDRPSISDLVDVLKTENFFRKPKGLGEIRTKLAEMGHHYPLTTLSGAMQVQVKRRSLRRFTEGGKYVYVQ